MEFLNDTIKAATGCALVALALLELVWLAMTFTVALLAVLFDKRHDSLPLERRTPVHW